MKKHVVSLLLLWSVVFGVWAEKGFVIQGSVDGITPQSMISLYRVDNGKRSLLDKAYVTRDDSNSPARLPAVRPRRFISC